MQGLSREDYERKKDEVADALVIRLEAFLPGLQEATVYREVSQSLRSASHWPQVACSPRICVSPISMQQKVSTSL